MSSDEQAAVSGKEMRDDRLEREMMAKTNKIFKEFIPAGGAFVEATYGTNPPVCRFMLHSGDAGMLSDYLRIPYDFIIAFPSTDDDVRMHMRSDPQVCISEEPPFSEEAVQEVISKRRGIAGASSLKSVSVDVFVEGEIDSGCSNETGFHVGPFICSQPDERRAFRNSCSYEVTCTSCSSKAYEIDYTNEYPIPKDCTIMQHYREVRDAGIPVIAGALGCKTVVRRKPGYTIEFQLVDPMRTPKALLKAIQTYPAAQKIAIYHERMSMPDPTTKICYSASRAPRAEKFVVQGMRPKRQLDSDEQDDTDMSSADAHMSKIARLSQ